MLPELSDVVTFTDVPPLRPECLERTVAHLKRHGRPILCTEYLARRDDCLFQTHLPIFSRERIGCFNWGLVDGKTQTKFAWTDRPDARHPESWFHDVLHADGRPYCPKEVAFLRETIARENAAAPALELAAAE